MDPFSDLPRITQHDLLQRAANFADEMGARTGRIQQILSFLVAPHQNTMAKT